MLNCIIRNSKHSKAPNSEKRYSGIGLTNVKKSLELHFGNKFVYEVKESETEYMVHLSVPIE